jgi:ATP-dependent Clp endopeptidase proteolytic subunit ClpP
MPKKSSDKKKETLEELAEDFADEVVESSKQPIYIINNIADKSDKDDIRAINCYGDITERMAAEVVQAMLYFNHTKNVAVEDEKGNILEEIRPFKMYISTHGGIVSDMFSIIDIMGSIKEDCDIETIGIGKVMSAGVLILASGTKGSRKIGRNCRVMLHSVISGHHGSFPNIENEMKETKELQDMYFDYLCSCTKLTRNKIKKLLLNNVDAYLSAEEAIKYGIADDYL